MVRKLGFCKPPLSAEGKKKGGGITTVKSLDFPEPRFPYV